MTKTYKLLIDSPEYPKGTTARGNAIDGTYDLYKPDGEEISQCRYLDQYQVENRPEVWELQGEKLDLRSPEAEKMREEARAKRWEFVPTEGYPYWSYDIVSKTLYNAEVSHLTGDWYCICWNIGNCHRTAKEALAWGEKYARYFLTE